MTVVPIAVQPNTAVIEMLNEGAYGEDASLPAPALLQKRAYSWGTFQNE
ncbi:MAG: hypothetical protein IAE89_16650 [Anaerolineae bacterium]|nr:hypothetical protein [Anaerolineae bacterium]